MKTFYKRLRAVSDISSDDFPQGLSIVMMIFFVLFGAACLFMLL